MGRPKQLLPIRGKAAVRYGIETVIAAGVADVVVVIAKGSPVGEIVQDLPVRVVCNDDPDSDMAGSVRAGLQAVPSSSRSILVCLADHPLVAADTIGSILSEADRDLDKIIIPRYQGRRGHPTLFPRIVIDEVAQGKILRDIIGVHAAEVIHLDVNDEGVVLDMDTEEDYEKLKQKAES